MAPQMLWLWDDMICIYIYIYVTSNLSNPVMFKLLEIS